MTTHNYIYDGAELDWEVKSDYNYKVLETHFPGWAGRKYSHSRMTEGTGAGNSWPVSQRVLSPVPVPLEGQASSAPHYPSCSDCPLHWINNTSARLPPQSSRFTRIKFILFIFYIYIVQFMFSNIVEVNF